MRSVPRSAVRLLPGPFLDAQATALDYLLSLDPDRLLAPLRREAGLPPVAEPYGNWESSGLDGHTLLTTVELTRDGAAAVLRDTGRARDAYQHVIFPNYRLNSQRFLAVAMGFPPEALLCGSVAELAHCFSADILVTLSERHADGSLVAGQRLLASSTGPHSWLTIALEVL